jgi:hypothetical protein
MRLKKKSKLNRSTHRADSKNGDSDTEKSIVLPIKANLTYAQSLKLVEINYDNKMHHLNINDQLEIQTGLAPSDSNAHCYLSKRQTHIKLPNINVETVEDLDDGDTCKAVNLPASYRKYTEKSVNEFGKLIEYDMDEEDVEWLSLINESRKFASLNHITFQQFERIMDCLEKESYFKVKQICVFDTCLENFFDPRIVVAYNAILSFSLS